MRARIGTPLDADQQHVFALYLAESHYGNRSEALLPAIESLSDWYLRTGQLNKAKRLVNRGIEITEAEGSLVAIECEATRQGLRSVLA